MSVSFVQHRIQAEARARKLALERSATTEVRIADIYKYFPFRLFGLNRDALQDLARIEFDAELELCRVNPEMLEQYIDMKRGGFRTGFISDTYWNTDQLAQLLRSCSPGLTWDFLYASCDHGSSKSEALFGAYLAEQGIDAASSFHVGDNHNADIKGARRHGIRPRYYPQASAALASKLQRETSIFELLCPDQPSRLDCGARTLRRAVTARSAEQSPAFNLGVTVLGPVMAAFDAFIEARRTALAREGARVAIGFLGRDGLLPYRVWQASHDETGAYLEINRRVSLVGSADTLEPLSELLSRVVKIDAPTFVDIVKVQPPAVMNFFAQYPDGIASGRELADALPDLMDPREITDIAAGIRSRLLAYIRAKIANFDDCTDLILVDLGYSASVQKSLRRIFDREGIRTRLHGVYLLTLDDAFDDVADDDTAEGLISDRIVTPHVKRMLIRNVALLEQLCCSDEGSARDYRGGEVLREGDQRPAAQLALANEVQSGALAYASRARDLAPRYALQPDADPAVAARWATAVLGRLLLLPDDDELVLLGGIRHDVNLGTQALAPLLDANLINDCIIARGLSTACTAPAPPMWLAGSFAALSPSHAYLYTLFGANRLPANVFGEAQCGTLQVGLFGHDGQAALEPVSVYHTGLGDLRLRIPLSRRMAVATIALPLAKLTRHGMLHGITVQYGESAAKAAESSNLKTVAEARLIDAGLERRGRQFRADTDDGMLLIPVDGFEADVAIYTIALTALDHDRILAVEDRDDNRAPAATLSWRNANDAKATSAE
ncbi:MULTISPECIES: type I pantothenate kinase [Bradyrhizobium]|nr:type I pantothenate kinase [Bradyrhizobium viridifuturi]ERF81955.1 MAG: type I pantothenate kinase [Bradyrhizobium sp. DFCI-1]